MCWPLSVSLVCRPSKRDSPGLNGFSNCLVSALFFPCPSTLRANLLPVSTMPSTARSFATCGNDEHECQECLAFSSAAATPRFGMAKYVKAKRGLGQSTYSYGEPWRDEARLAHPGRQHGTLCVSRLCSQHTQRANDSANCLQSQTSTQPNLLYITLSLV
jgi:hypothetical protein